MTSVPDFDFTPPPPSPPDADGGGADGRAGADVVATDLPCRKCGYNLRGLALAGRCPECGSAVGLSAQGDFLRYSDPKWVFTLQRGVLLILCGIGVIVLGVILGTAIGFAGWNAGGTGPSIAAAGLLGNALIVIGSWLLTEPDPSGLGEAAYGTARKVIRVTLAVGVLQSFVDVATTLAPPPPAVFQALQVLGVLFGIVGLIGTFAQLQYLRKLAFRIPDHGLAGRAHFLTYAIGISYGVLLLLALAVLLVSAAGTPGDPWPLAALGCVGGIAGLALLVFGIMYLFMLDRLRRRFGDEARAAQASWARVAARE